MRLFYNKYPVLRQRVEEEPSKLKCADKFMVQSTVLRLGYESRSSVDIVSPSPVDMAPIKVTLVIRKFNDAEADGIPIIRQKLKVRLVAATDEPEATTTSSSMSAVHIEHDGDNSNDIDHIMSDI